MAGALAAGLLSGAVAAQEPTPNTFVDVPVPQLTGWNEVNRLTVQPGVDGYSGASARTQVYTTQIAKEAAETAFQTDPDGADIEDALWADSPAAVYFELDDGSGRPPGIQVVTDDLDFPTNNCIMASGERESTQFPETVVPKICSDAPGSSKRYFLEIRDAGVPVDLVFDVGLKDIRYGGVKDPADDGGEALEAFREEYGIGRIYRVIQKVVNNTDQRLLGIKLELGHGVGGDFVPFNFADDGVAFELRPLVPREFFDGETGAPDVEVWNEDRFATYAPKLFDTGERVRFDPGFFSHQAAGLFPPQELEGTSDKTQFIFSGDDTNENGYSGALTQNYFSMVDEQAMGTGLPQGLFGYWLSDSLAPIVIGRYDEGNPEGESDAVEAWYDGSDWRYGLAGDPGTSAAPFSIVPDSILQQWAVKLLGIDPAQLDDSVRYDSIISDDLANLNMDTYIYIGEGILNTDGNPKFDSITFRVTAIPTTAFQGVGNETPPWIDGDGNNTAPSLSTYLITEAPVALNDLTTTFEQVETTDSNYDPDALPLNIPILANDVFNGQLLSGSAVTVNSFAVNGTVVFDAATPPSPAAEVEVTDEEGTTIGTVVLNEEGVLPSVDFTPVIGFTGLASFNYTVNATYDDGTSVKGPADSNQATVSVRVNAFPDPDAPIALNDSAVTYKDTSVTIDVLANDSLPAGTPTVAILDEPLTGSAAVEDGQVVYMPQAGYIGLDRFTYTVTTDGNRSNAALITVQVRETPEIYVPPGTEPEEPEEVGPSKSSGGIFGCSYNPGAPFDPTLLLIAFGAIGGLAWRNRRRRVTA
ncbi:MAG: choice-of-anchor F family protein [Halospina sp.]